MDDKTRRWQRLLCARMAQEGKEMTQQEREHALTALEELGLAIAHLRVVASKLRDAGMLYTSDVIGGITMTATNTERELKHTTRQR